MLPESFTPELLHSLELLKLRSRKSFLGSRQGGYISPKKGHGMEFSDYRRYEPGDNPRDLDWNVFGRTEKLYVKRFQEEQDLSVLVLLDTTASMLMPEGEMKWERSREIALALSYVALMEQNKLYLSAPAYLDTPGLTGGRAFHQLCSQLSALKITGSNDFFSGVNSAIAGIRFPGIAVLISDFLMPLKEIEKICQVMRAKNLEVTAIQVLAPGDVEPLPDRQSATVVDSETGEEVEINMPEEVREDYKYLLREHNTRLRQLLSQNRIACVSTLSNQNLYEFLVNHLPETGLLR